jgi:Fur family transcriptional regulator, ferric uptake regulator
VSNVELVHTLVSDRLSAIGQRYTASRRDLVSALNAAGKPVSLPELLTALPGVPQSTAYRNLALLTQTGAVQRLASSDEFGRFELTEALTGHHHHHLQCTSCGTVADIELSASFERAFAKAEAELSVATGFVVTTHEVSFEGLCAQCRVP